MAKAIARFSIFVLGVSIAAALASVPFLKSLNVVQDKMQVKVRDQLIVADVAEDDAARAKGLGGRASIGVNDGMLFLFDTPGQYPFWMKDMKFAIDIVWIAEDDTIAGFVESVAPQTGASDAELAIYTPPVPVSRVLELKAGRVKLLRAAVGDTVNIRPLVEQAD